MDTEVEVKVRELDAKNRPLVHDMTDSEKLDEILISVRMLSDMIDGFVNDLQSGKINPMMMIRQMMTGR